MLKSIKELTAQEALALAIAAEEEDGRIYSDFAHRIAPEFPDTAKALMVMHDEENDHRQRLLEIYKKLYGDHIPLIRREHVRGFIARKPIWLQNILTVSMIRREVELMEQQARTFYLAAAAEATNTDVRKIFGDLAAEEGKHYDLAETMRESQRSSGALEKEDASERKAFVLQIVQPGLAGLMDGSVSTLAPVFAAATASQSSHDAFVVGMAASVGAGISMGLTEALSDDGVLSGRGHPWLRGWVCGLMTTLGGVGHTVPFLIHDYHLALWVAIAVVLVELGIIAWIRHRYMDTPLLQAMFQIVVGGILVFLAGILIGGA
ncbi:rubrerythrin [Verrucomicrobia bacterium LW23]|nr:rubrerythrin [Verrucomicrobia bacterium LW23]